LSRSVPHMKGSWRSPDRRQPAWPTPTPLDPVPQRPQVCIEATRRGGARDKRTQCKGGSDSTPSAPPAMVVSVPGIARQSSAPISAAGSSYREPRPFVKDGSLIVGTRLATGGQAHHAASGTQGGADIPVSAGRQECLPYLGRVVAFQKSGTQPAEQAPLLKARGAARSQK
jgi:hypothetical protein